MKTISLDIDDTITAYPEYFSNLSRDIYGQGGKVVIISSRLDTPEIRQATELELANYGIQYAAMYLFKSMDDMPECPYQDLDWQDQYLWQKVQYAVAAGVTRHYDDDERVLNLFKKYGAGVEIVDAKRIGSSS